MREQIRKLKTELTEYKRAERPELTELRQRVHILTQHVQALTLDNQALRHTLSDDGPVRALRQQAAEANTTETRWTPSQKIH